MSAAGPAYVQQHFDIIRCTKKIEDLYDDILSVAGNGAGMPKSAKPAKLTR